MNRRRLIGAIKTPALLAIWSAGLVIFGGHFYRADASLISAQPILFPAMADIPNIDVDALTEGLVGRLSAAEVSTGAWQPESRRESDSTHAPTLGDVGRGGDERSRLTKTEAAPLSITRQKTEIEISIKTLPEVPSGDGYVGDERSGGQIRMVKSTATTTSVSRQLTLLKREARRELADGHSGQVFDLLRANVVAGRNDVEFLGLFALAGVMQKRFSESYVIYEKLVQLDGDNERWWTGLAVCNDRLNRDASVAFTETVNRADDDSSRAGVLLSNVAVGRIPVSGRGGGGSSG